MENCVPEGRPQRPLDLHNLRKEIRHNLIDNKHLKFVGLINENVSFDLVCVSVKVNEYLIILNNEYCL